jgi:hypothetical protein
MTEELELLELEWIVAIVQKTRRGTAMGKNFILITFAHAGNICSILAGPAIISSNIQ